MLQGHVEMDEAYGGGRRPGKCGRGADGEPIVMGMSQHGGSIRTAVIPNVKKPTLRNVVLRNVKPSLVVSPRLARRGVLPSMATISGSLSRSPSTNAV
jgi:transposase-like protein